jgi:hypothetical protein
MAYTTEALIESEFKSVDFGASTAITSSDITEFISQEESLLNARLSGRYVMPTTGTEAVKIMRRLSTMMIKARVLDILEVKTGDTTPDQGMPGDGLRKQVDDIVKMILEGDMDLVDATLSEASEGVSDYNSRNIQYPEPTPTLIRTFGRDSTQW